MEKMKSLLPFLLGVFLHSQIVSSSPLQSSNRNCIFRKLDSTERMESASMNAILALEGFSNFAVDLFKDVVDDEYEDPDENIFLSPLSVWSALTATYLGANNETANQLSRALNLDKMNREQISEAYRLLKIWYYLRTEGQSQVKYVFRMANKLFFQNGEPVRHCIRQLLDSEIMMVDFASQPEEARAEINDWVKEQTNEKIVEIVPPGYVDRTTRMVLVNAAYFKGTWEKQFSKFMTEDRPFYVQPNRSIRIPMMHQSDIFNTAKSQGLNCSMVELPYTGNEISMFVLLPAAGTNSAEKLIHDLSPEKIKNLISSLKPTSISLALPRFDMEQASELSESLGHMGIEHIFNPITADLSGFTGSADFFVSKVHHKVFVNCNEKGTEAAAATSLISLRSGILPEEFHVNRPFVFIIRDNILDSILFVGLVRKPHE